MVFNVNLAIVGPGLVGSEFLAQVAAHQARASANLRFSVVAVSNSRKMLLGKQIPLASWKADLAAGTEAADLTKLAEHAAANSPCVIVDCTSNESVATSYPAWLDKGIHVVTPNKKAFSGSIDLWNEIQQKSKGKARVFHESTVGCVTCCNVASVREID